MGRAALSIHHRLHPDARPMDDHTPDEQPQLSRKEMRELKAQEARELKKTQRLALRKSLQGFFCSFLAVVLMSIVTVVSGIAIMGFVIVTTNNLIFLPMILGSLGLSLIGCFCGIQAIRLSRSALLGYVSCFIMLLWLLLIVIYLLSDFMVIGNRMASSWS
jgi:magnesium-transporting ATPase (P-type)